MFRTNPGTWKLRCFGSVPTLQSPIIEQNRLSRRNASGTQDRTSGTIRVRTWLGTLCKECSRIRPALPRRSHPPAPPPAPPTRAPAACSLMPGSIVCRCSPRHSPQIVRERVARPGQGGAASVYSTGTPVLSEEAIRERVAVARPGGGCGECVRVHRYSISSPTSAPLRVHVDEYWALGDLRWWTLQGG